MTAPSGELQNASLSVNWLAAGHSWGAIMDTAGHQNQPQTITVIFIFMIIWKQLGQYQLTMFGIDLRWLIMTDNGRNSEIVNWSMLNIKPKTQKNILYNSNLTIVRARFRLFVYQTSSGITYKRNLVFGGSPPALGPPGHPLKVWRLNKQNISSAIHCCFVANGYPLAN